MNSRPLPAASKATFLPCASSVTFIAGSIVKVFGITIVPLQPKVIVPPVLIAVASAVYVQCLTIEAGMLALASAGYPPMVSMPPQLRARAAPLASHLDRRFAALSRYEEPSATREGAFTPRPPSFE